MTLVVYVANEGVRVPVAKERLSELARRVLRSEGVDSAMLSIAFISSAAIARMNRTHLGKKGDTDVIAFGLSGARQGSAVIGDIYISPAVARRNARQLGISVREEIARLVIHGTLHVIGHTHPDGPSRVKSEMWRLQEKILRRGIPPARITK